MANQIVSSYNSTNGRIFLSEVGGDFERIEFQFIPQELNTERTVKLSPIEIVARNNDIHQLTGGNDTISFQLDFYASDEDLDSVINRVEWLSSLGMTPQRNVKLVWGDMFTNDVFIVSGVSAKYSNFRVDRNFNPMQAVVNLTLKMNPDENRSISDIRNPNQSNFNNLSTIGFL